MAAFGDFYTPPSGPPLEWTLGEIGIQESDTREDAGLAKNRMDVNFGRNLSNLVNTESARGTVRGGWAGVRADRLRNDYDFDRADVDRLMNRHLSALARNRIMATLGVTI
jgi:hypothetical protein